MNDRDLAEALVPQEQYNEKIKKMIEELDPQERASYEELVRFEQAYKLWREGNGPKPHGIICECKDG